MGLQCVRVIRLLTARAALQAMCHPLVDSIEGLLASIGRLQLRGCTVNTNNVGTVPVVPAARPTDGTSGHRRTQIDVTPGKCQLADYMQHIEAVNTACCDANGICSAGVPDECDAKCAIAFVGFYKNCSSILSATIQSPEQVQKFADLSTACNEISATALLDAIDTAVCPAEPFAPCASSPCQNGGVCGDSSTEPTMAAGTYSCQCTAAQWFGNNCETSEDDCHIGGGGFGADPCLAQPGTTCTDCARGSYVKFQYVANALCPMGYTCE